MDLQTIFYSVAITFIGLWIVFLLGLIVFGIVFVRRLGRWQGLIESKLHSPTTSVLLRLAPLLPAVGLILMKLLKRRR